MWSGMADRKVSAERGGMAERQGAMSAVLASLAGVSLAILYRLVRHRAVFPRAAHEHVVLAWLKFFFIILVVAIGLFIAVTLIVNFPD
jgi:hypothetical protein